MAKARKYNGGLKNFFFQTTFWISYSVRQWRGKVPKIYFSTSPSLNLISLFPQAAEFVEKDVLESYCWMYSSWNIPPQYKGACSSSQVIILSDLLCHSQRKTTSRKHWSNLQTSTKCPWCITRTTSGCLSTSCSWPRCFTSRGWPGS